MRRDNDLRLKQYNERKDKYVLVIKEKNNNHFIKSIEYIFASKDIKSVEETGDILLAKTFKNIPDAYKLKQLRKVNKKIKVAKFKNFAKVGYVIEDSSPFWEFSEREDSEWTPEIYLGVKTNYYTKIFKTEIAAMLYLKRDFEKKLTQSNNKLSKLLPKISPEHTSLSYKDIKNVLETFKAKQHYQDEISKKFNKLKVLEGVLK